MSRNIRITGLTGAGITSPALALLGRIKAVPWAQGRQLVERIDLDAIRQRRLLRDRGAGPVVKRSQRAR
ncbi:MAG TPA: hypothetical protein VE650_04340 [Acetobacteraceae bacterium]|nr:hypothetical protein [Acetobacteraceae bacterium]